MVLLLYCRLQCAVGPVASWAHDHIYYHRLYRKAAWNKQTVQISDLLFLDFVHSETQNRLKSQQLRQKRSRCTAGVMPVFSFGSLWKSSFTLIYKDVCGWKVWQRISSGLFSLESLCVTEATELIRGCEMFSARCCDQKSKACGELEIATSTQDLNEILFPSRGSISLSCR